MVKVAVLVMHYQVDLLTDRAVEQLLAQDCEHDLYVVDGGSPEPYRNREVKLLRVEENLGLAGSINWAMEKLAHKAYDYVLHYTNDVTCTPEMVGNLVRRLEANLELAAIQPSMPSWHAHLNPRRSDECVYATYLEWAAVLVNMAAWEDVGPFDEGFNFFSLDIDWSYRARKIGWMLAVDYGVRCGHPWRGTHNVTEFSINKQALKEHSYGTKKYGTVKWQQFLMQGHNLEEVRNVS